MKVLKGIMALTFTAMAIAWFLYGLGLYETKPTADAVTMTALYVIAACSSISAMCSRP